MSSPFSSTPASAGPSTSAPAGPSSQPQPQAKAKHTKKSTKVQDATGLVEVDMEAYRHSAIIKNSKGVWLISKDNPEKSAVVVAGYLGFGTGTELRAFWDQAEVIAIMTPFLGAKEVKFRIVGKTDPAIKVNLFHKTVSDLKTVEVQLVCSDDEFPLDNTKANLKKCDIRIAYLSYICAALRLLKIFQKKSKPHRSREDLFLGYSPENWNRALVFIKCYDREHTGQRAKEKSRATTEQRNRAILPVFLTADDFATILDADEDVHADAAAKGDDNDFYTARDRLEEILKEADEFAKSPSGVPTLSEVSETASDDKEHTFQTQLSKMALSNIDRTSRSVRPKLSKKQIYAFTSGLAKYIKINWSAEDAQQMRRDLTSQKSKFNLDVSEMTTLTHSLDPKDTEITDEEVNEHVEAALLEIQEIMTANRAEMPDWSEACKYVGVDPNDLSIPGILDDNGTQYYYKFWQILGAYFMSVQEDRTFRACMLALACGLGKTLTTLLFIQSQNNAKIVYNNEHPDDPKPYQATLIIVPPASIEVWHDDKDRFFPSTIHMRQFYGTSAKIDPSRLSNLIDPNVESLNEFLDKLDPKDPQTGVTVVLTAYSTWWNRTLGTKLGDNITLYYQSNLYKALSKQDDALQDLQNGRVWASLVRYTFDRIVLDEAHTIRNPQTLVSEGVKQTPRGAIHFLTATPIQNACRDLRGYLSLCWRKEFGLYRSMSGFIEAYDDDFDPSQFDVGEDSEVGAGKGVQNTISFIPPQEEEPERYQVFQRALANNDRVWLLDPENYKRCGDRNTWNPTVAARIMPPILKMLQFRLTSASQVDLGDGAGPRRVGEDVPPCHIHTIELEMPRKQKTMYDTKTETVINGLYVGVADTAPRPHSIGQRTAPSTEQTEGIMDGAVYRYLMHCGLDPRLSALTIRHQEKQQSAMARRNNWIDIDFDHGASFYFIQTRHDSEYVIPPDRLSLAHYACARSVKIQYMLHLVGEWCLKAGDKVILVFEYPMSQWTAEFQLINLGFTCVSLNSTLSQEQRKARIHAFNYDPQVQILLFNTKLGVQSLNLHCEGHRIIGMELPMNWATWIQVIGRICRIGQAHPQTVYLLYTNYSYDQICLHRNSRKFVAAIAGEGRAAPDGSTPREFAEETLRRFLGLKYSAYPLVWGSKDYTEKDEYIKDLEARAKRGSISDPTPNDAPALRSSASAIGASNTPTPKKARAVRSKKQDPPKALSNPANVSHTHATSQPALGKSNKGKSKAVSNIEDPDLSLTDLGALEDSPTPMPFTSSAPKTTAVKRKATSQKPVGSRAQSTSQSKSALPSNDVGDIESEQPRPKKAKIASSKSKALSKNVAPAIRSTKRKK